VNAFTSNDWQAESAAAAEGVEAVQQAPSRSQKLEVARDTLIALGMQLSFRVATFLRHLNY
jgi:hypothetical protein